MARWKREENWIWVSAEERRRDSASIGVCRVWDRCTFAESIPSPTRGFFEACTKLGAYVVRRSYSVWNDGKQGESGYQSDVLDEDWAFVLPYLLLKCGDSTIGGT